MSASLMYASFTIYKLVQPTNHVDLWEIKNSLRSNNKVFPIVNLHAQYKNSNYVLASNINFYCNPVT